MCCCEMGRTGVAVRGFVGGGRLRLERGLGVMEGDEASVTS